MKNSPPLLITKKAVAECKALKIQNKINKSLVLNVKATENEPGVVEFNIFFAKKDKHDHRYTTHGLPFVLDMNTALQLCGSKLDYTESEFVFTHQEYAGHTPPNVDEVIWN